PIPYLFRCSYNHQYHHSEMIMHQVNATEIQEHLSDFLDSLTQGETSIIIEKAQKSDRYYH
ncbi:MAG: type II toxin-antitoxin system Phd/YefM family antitoxin, partial [Dolichospermum sp.]